MRHLRLLALFLLVSVALAASRSKHLKSLDKENWRDVLTGEWMVKFHAPWCPACKDLQKAWNSFAEWSPDLHINVAEVDVTTNPELSGRFLVTALPTIYHVKDGVFRFYVGQRDKSDFISFIEDKRWSLIEPVPSYKYPDSLQMGVVAVFFRLSMTVRDLHNHLVENIGIPSWASYAGFAAITLTLGCVLGFFIVCIIDYVFPTGVAVKKSEEKNQKKNQKNNKKNSNSSSGTTLNEDKVITTEASSQEGSSDESAEIIGDKSPASSQKKAKNNKSSDKKGDSKKNK